MVALDENRSDGRNKIRVMLVDDSLIVRGAVRRIMTAENSIEVVAAVGNGQLAVDRIVPGTIDVIILDVEMPVMDGITAIPLILAKDKNVKILMSSTLTHRGAEISMQAMSLGASDFIAKPSASAEQDSQGSAAEFAREIIAKVQTLGAQAQKRRNVEIRSEPSKQPPIKPTVKRSFDPKRRTPGILAIGCSTGGPQALLEVFRNLDAGIRCPVMVTQHMPPHFTEILAKHIDQVSPLTCTEAVDGDILRPGHIYVAPGDFHMTVEASGTTHKISLNQNPTENFCRPSVDPMFRSIAKCFGPQVLAVVLTGMGRDGASGAEAIAKAGGWVIAQDEKSSVVWGMPGAVHKTGICEALLSLNEIAPYINDAMKAVRHVS